MPRKCPHLLVVDDHDGIRRLLSEVLTEEGYTVEMASSGTEALRMVRANLPMLVIMDVKMPGLSGLQTISELKKIAPQLPIILITAYTELREVIIARDKGHIRYYLRKPFDLVEVRHLVHKALSDSEVLSKYSMV